MKKKEKRDSILYVSIRPTIKKWLVGIYKKQGYTTLSEFVDDLLAGLKAKK